MSQYVLAPDAQEDIKEIADYVTRQSPQNAAKVVRKLYEQFDRLADFPGLGHTREELRNDSLRVIAVYNYLVVYDPTTKPLKILRVVHGARDLRRVRPR